MTNIQNITFKATFEFYNFLFYLGVTVEITGLEISDRDYTAPAGHKE